MTVNKITNAPTQNEIINSINDLIDNKQDTLIAGTDLEIINAVTPLLPTGYTELEYIEGTGTQYIDTGFYGTQNSGAYIRFALTDLTSEGSARVFGTRIGTAGTKAFAFISSYDGSSLPSDKFYIGSNGYASWPANLDTNWHEVSCNIENDKKVYFDGNLIITGGNTAYTSTAQASIFRRYNQNTYSGKSATAKISILQIYENAVMVHNYIPCRRDSDDELGMYDLVSNTFLGNSGTGTFTGGPEVIYPTTTTINFTNASGYTTNEGTVTSVNNTQPDANGDVTLTIPTVNDGVLTITQNGTSKGTFSANQSTNNTIALTDTTYNAFTGADGTNAGSSGLVPAPSATDNDKYLKGDGTWASVSGGSSTDVQINGTSVTNQGVANILTQTAYDATSNKIATMSDLPADKIFIAIYGTTTFNEIKTAITNGKIVLAKAYNLYYSLTLNSATVYAFSYFLSDACYIVEVTNGNLWSSGSYTYQQTSTAVTHPASTAIGGVDVPVFVNSNGVVTSTGKSIASSRFDGQWVYKFLSGSSATAVGTVTIDLSSYLPSDSYKYEVLINLCLYSNPSSGGTDVFLWSDVFQNTNTGQDERVARCNANSRASENRFTMPVGTGRWIKRQIVDKAATVSCNVSFWGYRRIGTNT